MKMIRNRIMLASSLYFAVRLGLVSALGFVHPAFVVFAMAWVFGSRPRLASKNRPSAVRELIVMDARIEIRHGCSKRTADG